MFNLDINPYETDEERQVRELERLAAIDAAVARTRAAPGMATDVALPPRAQAALASYVPPAASDVTAGKIRIRPEAPGSVGELGVTEAPKFDPLTDTQRAIAATAPPAAQLPPGTNEALAKTGSKVQLPERAPFSRSAGTEGMLDRLDQNVNRYATLKQDEAAISADAGAQQSEYIKKIRTEGEASQAETLARRDEALARKDENMRVAYGELREMQRALGSPPDTTKGKALQIVGAILSMGKNGGNIGRGLSMIGQAMNDDVQAWAQGIEGNEQTRKAFMQMAANEDNSIESELRQEQGISNLAHANMLLALKEIETQSKSEAERNIAQQLALEVENKAIQFYVERSDRFALANAGRSGAGDSAAQKEQMLTALMRGLRDLPEEQRVDAAQDSGPLGVEALGLLRKASGKEDAAKMTDGDKKLQRLAEGVRPAYDSLAQRARRIESGEWAVPYRGIGPGATQFFADEDTQQANSDIMQIANVLLRDESGASIPENEQKTKWATWGLESPDEAVRNRGLAKMLAEYEGRVSHVSPVTGGKGGGSGSAGASFVTMRSPSGRVVQVPAEKAERAKANGYSLQTTARGSSGSW